MTPSAFGRMASLSCLSLLCALLLLLGGSAWAALPYTVEIAAPDDLGELLAGSLELVASQNDPDMDEMQLEALVREAPGQAQTLLETEGYFSAKIRLDEESREPRRFRLVVEPGEPVLIDDVTLRLAGPVRLADDYQPRLARALELWPLPTGARFRQAEWDSGKRVALRQLQVDGYPRARIAASRADIDPATRRATLTVELDSADPVAFGPISVSGLKRYPEDIVIGMARFRPGAPYTLQRLLEYQSALEQSPYFSSVVVSADMAKISDGRVPVDVAVEELPRQKLALGLTYEAGEGLGTRIGYDHYNLFKRGYIGSILLEHKPSEQALKFGLSFPRQSDGYSHSLNAAFKRSDVQGVETDALEGGLWRIRSTGTIESRIGLEYLLEKETVADTLSQDNSALLLSYGWTRRQLDDLRRPRAGTLIDLQLSTTLGDTLSSAAFVRGYGKLVHYWSPRKNWGTLVSRIELGEVFTNNADRVPTSRLFRTGGATSVRGYEYLGLGLPGPDDSVLGGRVLAVGSLEYQIPISRDWSLALFHDAGNAADSWQDFSLAHSNGVGLRWMSPVAPLALDIAKAQDDGKIRWYLSLGLAF